MPHHCPSPVISMHVIARLQCSPCHAVAHRPSPMKVMPCCRPLAHRPCSVVHITPSLLHAIVVLLYITLPLCTLGSPMASLSCRNTSSILAHLHWNLPLPVQCNTLPSTKHLPLSEIIHAAYRIPAKAPPLHALSVRWRSLLSLSCMMN